MNDETTDNIDINATTFKEQNKVRKKTYKLQTSASNKFRLCIINIPKNYHHNLYLEDLFEIDFFIESSSLEISIDLQDKNNTKQLSLNIKNFSFNKAKKDTVLANTFGQSNIIIKPTNNNIDSNFQFSINHEIENLSITLSNLEIFKRLIFNAPKTSNYIIETNLDGNGKSFFNDIPLETNTNFLITHKKSQDNKQIFFDQILDDRDFYLKVQTSYSSDNLTYTSKKIFNNFFLYQESTFEKISISDINKLNLELKDRKYHFNNTNFILNNIEKVEIHNLNINRLEVSNNQELFINDSNIDCIKITNNNLYEFNNVKCHIANINNDYFYCLNFIKNEVPLRIIDNEEIDELYSKSRLIKIINKTYKKEHPLNELTFQNNKVNTIIQDNEKSLTYQIRTSNIHKVQINLIRESYEIIYFENFFYDFLEHKYDIELKKFEKSNVLFLPFKEGTLKEILPKIKNLTLKDLYYYKINLKTIFQNKKIDDNLPISLGFVENELRNYKIISQANDFAIFCEDLSLKKKNMIDSLWGSQYLYKYGYVKNPFLIFQSIFFILFIINFILIACYTNTLCLISPSDWFIRILEDKSIFKLIDYLVDALLPTFKLSSTGWLKLSAFITNLIMALNVLGLGISLKRRYSRNTS